MRELSPTPEIDAYLSYLAIEKGRSPRTISSYRHDLSSLEDFLADHDLTIRGAGPAVLDRYLAELRRQGRSVATISRARSSVRGLYRFLVDEGSIREDPMVNSQPLKVPSRLPKALREDEVARLIDGVSGDDPLSLRDRAILELLYGTGARVSEVVSLSLSDLAYDDGLLRVVGKGDKERLVPVGRAAQAALSAWLEPRGRGRMVEGRTGRRDDAEALFVNQQGRRLSRQGAHLIVAKRARAAGIDRDVSPHILRHSCATHMLAHGADVRIVQELLGHASVATTQLYTKVTSDHLVTAYTRAHPRAQGAPSDGGPTI